MINEVKGSGEVITFLTTGANTNHQTKYNITILHRTLSCLHNRCQIGELTNLLKCVEGSTLTTDLTWVILNGNTIYLIASTLLCTCVEVNIPHCPGHVIQGILQPLAGELSILSLKVNHTFKLVEGPVPDEEVLVVCQHNTPGNRLVVR